ncbi:50S ribosomal protein L23 [candidate division WWE3 bacterium RIFCSPHIGHO2_12_FULL_38_15]|uniref:Large ribosomal subunit protein uL23 n=1 Tax=candidate division WWE3 bacterium RIFCSPHIGHO2_02_FULL_38_14 TaxID=1802620 RepID=A0A1F4VBA9_UNCKA|nr:MAG: 50S ribosomal protein L23 [candidate division WWE3 bacterium RIFCSPHIGHO2_01_FULL_38_45]OGC49078.1 MAG: 50S ribosomal protein L23 [candidate division WWE3 bacterium RIFCSPHIGHO2_12_FULL_38_15]OGC53533.1 MAG: 50S ribosomal protein L23 [candidate division WWE3 bacterium RIFCSPLOWO2_01_FULL_37_24]OGC54437.1 MAG: 50S ribosomal protein L23 [candidate division WWE3 bacterium RIFCSPHIGHO2_02_FULL_38_14]HLB51682.1 50S ribosomal protein L23 [Patescibacteria group bacterium]
MQLNNVLQKPVITEKSVALTDTQNRYVFKVRSDATKGKIADEVEKTFKVDVLDVKTIMMPGKKRRIAKTFRFRKTKGWKKAIVKIKADQKIDIVSKEGK